MKRIQSKLHNSRGVSIIIAMVFMLICLFVGATVLTAASMNTARIRNDSKQQEFMNERSAAMLIADELRVVVPSSDPSVAPSYGNMRLMIHEDHVTRQKVIVKANGDVVIPENSAAKAKRALRFEVCLPEGAEMTAMQRTVIETTILNYMHQNGILPDTASTTPGDPFSIVYDNFIYKGTPVTGYPNMWFKLKVPVAGSVKLERSDLENSDPGKSFTANFISDAKPGRLYDYVVDFGDYSQMKVVLYASVGKNVNPTVEEIVTHGEASEKVTTENKLTVISWTDPLIVKGDLA